MCPGEETWHGRPGVRTEGRRDGGARPAPGACRRRPDGRHRGDEQPRAAEEGPRSRPQARTADRGRRRQSELQVVARREPLIDPRRPVVRGDPSAQSAGRIIFEATSRGPTAWRLANQSVHWPGLEAEEVYDQADLTINESDLARIGWLAVGSGRGAGGAGDTGGTRPPTPSRTRSASVIRVRVEGR